jgi:tRNA nucleotidyltransferase (CCA-adding enzyme)
MTGRKGARRPWTETENTELRQMLQAIRPTAETAAKLERTQQAIYSRVQNFNKKAFRTKPGSFGLKAKGNNRRDDDHTGNFCLMVRWYLGERRGIVSRTTTTGDVCIPSRQLI